MESCERRIPLHEQPQGIQVMVYLTKYRTDIDFRKMKELAENFNSAHKVLLQATQQMQATADALQTNTSGIVPIPSFDEFIKSQAVEYKKEEKRDSSSITNADDAFLQSSLNEKPVVETVNEATTEKKEKKEKKKKGKKRKRSHSSCEEQEDEEEIDVDAVRHAARKPGTKRKEKYRAETPPCEPDLFELLQTINTVSNEEIAESSGSSDDDEKPMSSKVSNDGVTHTKPQCKAEKQEKKASPIKSPSRTPYRILDPLADSFYDDDDPNAQDKVPSLSVLLKVITNGKCIFPTGDAKAVCGEVTFAPFHPICENHLPAAVKERLQLAPEDYDDLQTVGMINALIRSYLNFATGVTGVDYTHSRHLKEWRIPPDLLSLFIALTVDVSDFVPDAEPIVFRRKNAPFQWKMHVTANGDDDRITSSLLDID